jgi:uncharacterized protein (TIGR04255 family)
MSLPDVPRVIYGKNPLQAVICQLRFPPILRIAAEPPANFQDQIRQEYPLFRERTGFVAPGIPPEMLQALQSELSPFLGSGRTFDFLTTDEQWQLSLNQQHLALTATSYERWEGFRQHLESPYRWLLEIYRPSFFSRVGLRYRDVIRRSALGLADVPWSELLSPVIAGELGPQPIAENVEHAAREFVLRLVDVNGRVRVRHGILPQDSESCYVIDADFFLEPKTETNHAFAVLDAFNKQAGRLFRWCISERLHCAMEPRSVS